MASSRDIVAALFMVCSVSTLAVARMVDSSTGKSPYVGDFGAFVDHAGAVGSSKGNLEPIELEDKAPRSAGLSLESNPKNNFFIYSDWRSRWNHFVPSGWMGDYEDIALDDASREDPADGKTCIKIKYLARVSNGYAWTGIYWLARENNWGDTEGGFNLSGMKRLTFWARGAKGGENISEFRVGGVQGDYPDSGLARIGPITLAADWKKYQIDLSKCDLSRVAGGFAWSTSYAANPEGMTFYLDEIRFER